MGTWTYSHGNRQSAGCQDAPGAELSIGSCDGKCAQVVIRHQAREGDDEVIGSIHLPAESIPAAIWQLIVYGGVDPEAVMEYIRQNIADGEGELD